MLGAVTPRDSTAGPSPDAAVPRPRAAAAAATPGALTRRQARRRIVFTCAALAALLHTCAVAWTWASYGPGVRGSWLVWLDLPVSLLYLHLMGASLLPWSLLAGGLQWATTGGLLAWLVGRLARRDGGSRIGGGRAGG
jgi:hypothetical protein